MTMHRFYVFGPGDPAEIPEVWAADHAGAQLVARATGLAGEAHIGHCSHDACGCRGARCDECHAKAMALWQERYGTVRDG